MTRPTYYVDRQNVPQLTDAQCFKRQGKDLLYGLLGPSYGFMRVGRFAIITNGRTVLVAKMYDENNRDHLLAKDSPFYSRSKQDRLSQLDQVEAAIRWSVITPRFQEVLDDCAAERNSYAS